MPQTQSRSEQRKEAQAVKAAQVKPTKALVDDIDEILNEIDSVLEEVHVSAQYQQRGGQ